MKTGRKIFFTFCLLVLSMVILSSCEKEDLIGYCLPIEMEYEGVRVEREDDIFSSCVLPKEGGTIVAKAVDKNEYIRRTAKYLNVSINDEYERSDNEGADEWDRENMSYKDREWGEIYNIGTSRDPVIKIVILPDNSGEDREFNIDFGCCNNRSVLKIRQKGE